MIRIGLIWLIACLTLLMMSCSHHHEADPRSIFYSKLARLPNGVSFDEIQNLIGTGEHDNSWFELTAKTAESNPAVYPQGVLRSDSFVMWRPDNTTECFTLQFRDGKLVNFNPADYQSVPVKVEWEW